MLKKLDVPISTDGFSIVPIKGKKVVQCVFEHMIAANIGIYSAVSALSVAVYGMFLAIIIPPARKSKIVAALVAISFALSFACNYLPGISSLSEGTRTILLTVIISGAAAILFPMKQDAEEAVPAENGESVQKGDHVNE